MSESALSKANEELYKQALKEAKAALEWFNEKHMNDESGRREVRQTPSPYNQDLWCVFREVKSERFVSLMPCTGPMDVFEFLNYCEAKGWGKSDPAV